MVAFPRSGGKQPCRCRDRKGPSRVSTGRGRRADWSNAPPSTTSVVPVTNSAPARKTTASATSSGDPMRPSSVSAARRSPWSGLDHDRTWRDPAHPYLRRERPREDPGEHRLRRLGRAVRRERRPRLVGRDVLDHHDDPPGLAQVGRGGLGDEEAALGRRAERRVPVGLLDLAHRLGDEALAGRVHEEVEPAQLARRRSGRASGRLRRRQGRRRHVRRLRRPNRHAEAGPPPLIPVFRSRRSQAFAFRKRTVRSCLERDYDGAFPVSLRSSASTKGVPST